MYNRSAVAYMLISIVEGWQRCCESISRVKFSVLVKLPSLILDRPRIARARSASLICYPPMYWV